MKCPRCSGMNPDEPAEERRAGRGYATPLVCLHCGYPLVEDLYFRSGLQFQAVGLTSRQTARLKFVRWLLIDECLAQTAPRDRRRPGDGYARDATVHGQ